MNQYWFEMYGGTEEGIEVIVEDTIKALIAISEFDNIKCIADYVHVTRNHLSIEHQMAIVYHMNVLYKVESRRLLSVVWQRLDDEEVDYDDKRYTRPILHDKEAMVAFLNKNESVTTFARQWEDVLVSSLTTADKLYITEIMTDALMKSVDHLQRRES